MDPRSPGPTYPNQGGSHESNHHHVHQHQHYPSPLHVEQSVASTLHDKQQQEQSSERAKTQQEENWRNAMASVCAGLLNKNMEELRVMYENEKLEGRFARFSQLDKAHHPRDLVDYIIMQTLQTKDAFSMQNARSWLFNIMTRDGLGLVRKAEFVMYAPLMYPLCDPAVSKYLWNCLLSAQSQADEKEMAAQREKAKQKKAEADAALAAASSASASSSTASIPDSAPAPSAEKQESGTGNEETKPLVQSDVTTTSSGDFASVAAATLHDWSSFFSSTATSKPPATMTTDVSAEDKTEVARVLDLKQTESKDAPTSTATSTATIANSLRSPRVEKKAAEIGSQLGDAKKISALPSPQRHPRVSALQHIPEAPSPLAGSALRSTDHAGVDASAALGNVGAVSATPRSAPPSTPLSSTVNRSASMATEQAAGLRYDVWKLYVNRMQEIYDYFDPEWENAKSLLGLDPCEPIIYSSAAIDHSETIPALGKLYLSERYLVFVAGVGSRNYVIRLGCISSMGTKTLSFSMRDCIEIIVEPEFKSVLKGEGGVGTNAPSSSSTTVSSASYDQTPAKLAAALVKSYSVSGESILFSFPEFRESKLRDKWLNFIKEISAAHKLHEQYGFGSSGRPPAHDSSWPLESATSPFRHDLPSPLLAVAAALNVLRMRCLHSVMQRPTWLLLIFSQLDDHQEVAKYYIDSIRNVKTSDRQSWVSRTVQSIVENMEINSRIQNINEDEPFDVQKLGEVIIRAWELLQPAIKAYEYYDSIMQWKNPPATILALLACGVIAYKNWVIYIPSILLFMYIGVVLALRVKLVGVRGSDAEMAVASRDAHAGMFEFVKSVHDALQGAQNLLARYNRPLGKMETLNTWVVPWMTWVLLAALGVSALLLMILPLRVLFIVFVLDSFTRYFRYPVGALDQFWESIPTSYARATKDSMRGKSPKPKSA